MELWCAIFQDPDQEGVDPGQVRWIARSLLYAFIGEGPSADRATTNLLQAVKAEYEFAKQDGRRPFEGLPQDPFVIGPQTAKNGRIRFTRFLV